MALFFDKKNDMKLLKYLSALALMIIVGASCTKEETKIISDSNSYESKMNIWQSHRFVAGSQTGTYTAECDVVPAKDSIDGMFGMQSNVARTYSDVSTIVRFNSNSRIDIHNGVGYTADSSVVYTGNKKYHLRMEVDVPNLKYTVFVTQEGGNEIEIAKDYNFRNFAVFVDQWSTVSSDFNVLKPGLMSVTNVKVTEHTVNKVPVVLPIGIIRSAVEVQGWTTITAVDPLNGKLTMEAIDLPSFASYTDKGDGTISISYKATPEDVGNYKFKVKASSSTSSSEAEYDLYVTRNIVEMVDVADNSANSTSSVDWSARPQLLIGGFGAIDPNPGYDMAAVMPIMLPDFEAGEKLNFARLDVNLEVVTDWAWQDYDLYGLPFRSTPEVLAADFWQGDYGTDANAFAIQQQLFTRLSQVGNVSTSTDAGELLAEYINKQIENGAKPGDYIFLRININVANAPDWGMHKMSSADAVDETVRPKLELYFSK